MLFLVVTAAGGIHPIQAASPDDAADQIRQSFAAGLPKGFEAQDATQPAPFAVLLPQLTGSVQPGNPPTVVFSGDQSTQKTIRDAAKTALANNATYLGIASPTQAQAVAQVGALTRQVDGLVRFLVGDFTATT